MTPDEEIARIYREEASRILAALVSRIRDLDLAEEALQDAMAEAVVAWRRDGVPCNGGAWLFTASRRRAIDRLRRAARRESPVDVQTLIDRLEHWPEVPGEDDELPDERLRLIFTCCHPALPDEARVALTLRTLCGLTTVEIARAFLVSETTMRQRITRAKEKIRRKGIAFTVPEGAELSGRLESVLDVIYLIFNEGYAPTDANSVTRGDLCEEAIRLARILFKLTPDPEAGGLLALLLLNDARRPARVDEKGAYICLSEQDRSLWDEPLTAEGRRLLHQCLARCQPGQFQIQAAISAVHTESGAAEQTDWIQIAGLYVALSQAAPSPVVTLNHAVAVSHAESPEAGLALLDSVSGPLQSYQPFHAARADLLTRLGRHGEAREAYSEALRLTTNAPERRFLETRLADLDDLAKKS